MGGLVREIRRAAAERVGREQTCWLDAAVWLAGLGVKRSAVLSLADLAQNTGMSPGLSWFRVVKCSISVFFDVRC